MCYLVATFCGKTASNEITCLFVCLFVCFFLWGGGGFSVVVNSHTKRFINFVADLT